MSLAAPLSSEVKLLLAFPQTVSVKTHQTLVRDLASKCRHSRGKPHVISDLASTRRSRRRASSPTSARVIESSSTTRFLVTRHLDLRSNCTPCGNDSSREGTSTSAFDRICHASLHCEGASRGLRLVFPSHVRWSTYDGHQAQRGYAILLAFLIDRSGSFEAKTFAWLPPSQRRLADWSTSITSRATGYHSKSFQQSKRRSSLYFWKEKGWPSRPSSWDAPSNDSSSPTGTLRGVPYSKNNSPHFLLQVTPQHAFQHNLSSAPSTLLFSPLTTPPLHSCHHLTLTFPTTRLNLQPLRLLYLSPYAPPPVLHRYSYHSCHHLDHLTSSTFATLSIRVTMDAQDVGSRK